jgi:hypothetical protein
MYIREYERKIGDSPQSQSSLSFSQACQDLVRTKNARKKIRVAIVGGNVGFRTKKNSQFGGGQGVIAIANATVPPSGNPAGGGILYVQDGALMYLGPSGIPRVIAPA